MWDSIGDGTHTSQRRQSQVHVIAVTFSKAPRFSRPHNPVSGSGGMLGLARVEKGMRPTMARLTVARKIAAITLTMWKKGVGFDPQQLHRQAA